MSKPKIELDTMVIYRGEEWRVDSFVPARQEYGLIRGDFEAMDWSPEGNLVFVSEAELLTAINS
jgi:hypothetical protein